jgi:hypothetical protein
MATGTSKKVTAKMNPVKTTKNQYMFEVAGDKRMTSMVTNLYIKKEAFGDAAPPTEITVEVSW